MILVVFSPLWLHPTLVHLPKTEFLAITLWVLHSAYKLMSSASQTLRIMRKRLSIWESQLEQNECPRKMRIGSLKRKLCFFKKLLILLTCIFSPKSWYLKIEVLGVQEEHARTKLKSTYPQNLHFVDMLIFIMWTHTIFLWCVRAVKKVNSSFVTFCLGVSSFCFVSPLTKITFLDICLILIKDQCIALFKFNKPNSLKRTTFSILTRHTLRFHRWSKVIFWNFFNKEKDSYISVETDVFAIITWHNIQEFHFLPIFSLKEDVKKE